MTAGSSAKGKSKRGRKSDPKFVITEWDIKNAATPHHVEVSFVARQESIDGAGRHTTRCFRLRREQVAALVDEFRNLLDEPAGVEGREEQGAATVLPLGSARHTEGAREMDVDSVSSPFALGAAYGLLGN